jgi:hypothetical protein
LEDCLSSDLDGKVAPKYSSAIKPIGLALVDSRWFGLGGDILIEINPLVTEQSLWHSIFSYP